MLGRRSNISRAEKAFGADEIGFWNTLYPLIAQSINSDRESAIQEAFEVQVRSETEKLRDDKHRFAEKMAIGSY